MSTELFSSGRANALCSGNQGLDFRYVNREGFGWTNASFQIGLQCLTTGMRRAVAACTSPWDYFGFPAPQIDKVLPSAPVPDEHAPKPPKPAERRASDVRQVPTLQQSIAQLKGMSLSS